MGRVFDIEVGDFLTLAFLLPLFTFTCAASSFFLFKTPFLSAFALTAATILACLSSLALLLIRLLSALPNSPRCAADVWMEYGASTLSRKAASKTRARRSSSNAVREFCRCDGAELEEDEEDDDDCLVAGDCG